MKRFILSLLLMFGLAAPAAGQIRLETFTNNATAALGGNIADDATELEVEAGKGALFPSPTGGQYMWLTLREGTTTEIIKCTARTDDTISSCTRAQQGTAASAFTTAATVYLSTTASTFDNIKALTDLTFVVTTATSELANEVVLGTGVSTALQANVGSSGAPVVFGGALGTPSSGTATNITGLPIAGLTFAASDRIACRDSASGGAGESCTASAVLSMIGATQGNILYHNGTAWTVLAPGTNGDFLQTQGAGANPQWASGGSGSGDIEGVTAGTGLTDGGTTGTVTLNVGEGLAIDASADAVAFDPTELLGSRTFGDASTDTIVWTWNRATGTDPTLTFGDGSITLNGNLFVSDEAYDDSGWDGDLSTATKNAIRDVLETFVAITDPNVDAALVWDEGDNAVETATLPSIMSHNGTALAITLPRSYYFRLAVCQNTDASMGVDLFTSNAAVAACGTGSNTQRAFVAFADDATSEVQGGFRLPPNYSGAISASIKWITTEVTGDVVWQIATACTADGEAFDDSFNTASEVVDTAKGTTLLANDASIASVTVTGCAAGEHLQWKLFRDATHASDNLAAVASVIDIEFRVPEVF